MATKKELTVDEAIARYNSRGSMRRKSYDVREYSLNKMSDILESELSKGRLGKQLTLEYRTRFSRINSETVMKVGEHSWEPVGYLYNRKNGSMSGRYGTINSAYKNLDYVLRNCDCIKLHVHYV